jgi:uncharacterized membrane protein YbhN (UPF0104 family)
VLTVVVTWLIVDRVGLGFTELRGLDRSVWTPDPVPFVLASGLLLAGYFMSAVVWGWIVRELGGPALKPREVVVIFMVANLGRYLPGKIWQIAGLAALAKGRGVAPATATGAAVLGQGVAVFAAAAVGSGAMLAGPEQYRMWGAVGLVVVLAVAGLLAVPRVSHSMVNAWFRLVRADTRPHLSDVHTFRWLALYTLNWGLYAASFWVLVRSLGFVGPTVPIAGAFAAAYVLGYAMVFAPAGLGPREGFLLVFLTPHIGAAAAGVVAIVSRIWTTLVEVVPAGIFWIAHLAGPARRDGTSEAST